MGVSHPTLQRIRVRWPACWESSCLHLRWSPAGAPTCRACWVPSRAWSSTGDAAACPSRASQGGRWNCCPPFGVIWLGGVGICRRTRSLRSSSPRLAAHWSWRAPTRATGARVRSSGRTAAGKSTSWSSPPLRDGARSTGGSCWASSAYAASGARGYVVAQFLWRPTTWRPSGRRASCPQNRRTCRSSSGACFASPSVMASS